MSVTIETGIVTGRAGKNTTVSAPSVTDSSVILLTAEGERGELTYLDSRTVGVGFTIGEGGGAHPEENINWAVIN